MNKILKPLSTEQIIELIKSFEPPSWRNDPSYGWAQQVKDKRNSKLPSTGAAWKDTEIDPKQE